MIKILGALITLTLLCHCGNRSEVSDVAPTQSSTSASSLLSTKTKEKIADTLQKVADKFSPPANNAPAGAGALALTGIVFEDEFCTVIFDPSPQAPIHLVVISRQQIMMLSQATDNDQAILGHLLLVAKKMASKYAIGDNFRLVINNGPLAGQQLPVLHLHVMGGRKFAWPPG